MFSTRTIAISCALMMVTTMTANAQGKDKHHGKKDDAAEEEEEEPLTQKERDKARAKAKAKAKAAEEEEEPEPPKERAKAKSRPADEEEDSETERERERAKAKAKAKAKEAEEAAEKEKEKETESDGAPAAAGGDEAYHSGTLGFSIPFTVIAGAIGGAAGEPVPTVDIVYFLDDKTALDLIVGLNFHRKQVVDMMGKATTTNLIGIAAGVGYRMYSMKKGLRSYLEPQLVVSLPDVSATASLGLNLGASLGLERNVTPWFSVSAALGAALNLTSSFKDIQLATTAKLAANLYWH
jgi:hypothetical protein